MRSSSFAPLLALLALLAPAADSQAILTVDEFGGADHVELQAAVDAAAPGSLILVSSGTYDGLAIDGKPLAVVADTGANVRLRDGVSVRNLPANREVVLSGLRILEPANGAVTHPRIEVASCAGHVLLQEVDVDLSLSVVALTTPTVVRDCASVTFVDCLIASGSGSLLNATLPTLEIESSNTFLHDSAVRGLRGSGGPAPGGPGIFANESSLAAAGCQIIGGPGGDGIPVLFPTDGGDGGPALTVNAVAPLQGVVVYDTSLTPGAGGSAVFPKVAGNAGPPTQILAGQIDEPAAFARRFLAPAVLRAGVPANLTFSGQPFDLAWHVIGFDASPAAFVPELLGTVHPSGAPLLIKFRGTLDSFGLKTLTPTTSPTGIPYLPVYQQGLMYNATEGIVMSNPTFSALLD